MSHHEIMAKKALEKCSCPLSSPIVGISGDFEKIIGSARVDAYNETKAVAEGADPYVHRMKCYMPMCDNKLFFGDFKRAINIKEFLLSGMCQSCQDAFFD
jgi:hypothetical protein